MKYIEILQKLKKDFNPFLYIKPEIIVDKTDNFLIIPARAPYIKDHLLIIPKRKAYLLQELKSKERQEMFQLVEKWTIKLHKEHNDVNLLLRDGLVGGNTQKSINHLHFHLIPDCPVGALGKLNREDRKWIDDKKYENTTKDIKNRFLS